MQCRNGSGTDQMAPIAPLAGTMAKGGAMSFSRAVVNQFTMKGTFNMLTKQHIETIRVFANEADSLAATDNGNAEAIKAQVAAIKASASAEIEAVRNRQPNGFAARFHDVVTAPLIATLAKADSVTREVMVERIKRDGFDYKARSDKAKAAWRKQQQFLLTVCERWSELPEEIRERLALAYLDADAITVQQAEKALTADEKAAAKAEKKALAEAKKAVEAEMVIAERAASLIQEQPQLFSVADMARHLVKILSDSAALADMDSDTIAAIGALADTLTDARDAIAERLAA